VHDATGHILVEERFNGPPASGNGGYVCGLVGALLGPGAEVTLRSPPPLCTAMAVERRGDELSVYDGETLVAEARAATVELDVPPVSFGDAERATQSYRGFDWHPVPGCFVCGPRRPAGDGLRIFAGALGRDGTVAAPWEPAADLAGDDGQVRPEFVWAALDCPGAFAFDWDRNSVPVLGRLAAQLLQPVSSGKRHVVVGWPLGSTGQKFLAGTAVLSETGEVLAVARSTWFHVEPDWLEGARD
jgi:hypothetical protein